MASLSIMVEFANEALRDYSLIAAAIFAHEQAQLLGFYQASRSPRFTVSNKGGCNLACDPLLVCEPVADCIDHPSDTSKTMKTSSRKVGHVCYAAKWQQVMRTNTMDSNASDDHHIIPMIIEARAKRLCRIDFVAVE
ncbi:hypothetical protein WM04_15235 [Burkholderia ubonensis]|nr:hypothetical protein WM04_15235 [Burkholderia ubonensis]OJB11838.1 hypothetical protein BGV53_27735 [Burkholderia ubonensis]